MNKLKIYPKLYGECQGFIWKKIGNFDIIDSIIRRYIEQSFN